MSTVSLYVMVPGPRFRTALRSAPRSLPARPTVTETGTVPARDSYDEAVADDELEFSISPKGCDQGGGRLARADLCMMRARRATARATAQAGSATRPLLDLLPACLGLRFGADVVLADVPATARADDVALGGAP